MNRYERAIGLRTIYMTLIRRTEMILAIFLPLFIASYVVTQYMMPKAYTSTSTISDNGAITQPNYELIKMKMKDTTVLEATVNSLKGKGYTVTTSEISSSLNFSAFASNMVSFTVSFKSKDAALAKQALTDFDTAALENAKASYASFANLTISSPAGDAQKTSSEDKYFLIGAAASFVLALGIPFVYEIVKDEVFESRDIEDLGALGAEVRCSGK